MTEEAKKEYSLYLSQQIIKAIDELVAVNKKKHNWNRSWLVNNILADRLGVWPWKDYNEEKET